MKTAKEKTVSDTNSRISDETFEHPSTMDARIYQFVIAGITPLLQNNPTNFIGAEDGKDALGVKKKYNDAEEAKLRLYTAKDGIFYHPCQAFIKALVGAASGKKFGKFFATSLLKGSVFIAEPFVTIETENGEPATVYDVDRQPCVVGKARILRCRPRFFPWFMRPKLEIDVAILSVEQVAEVLALAGKIRGIGDYRPEKGGGFGRFRIKGYKEVE